MTSFWALEFNFLGIVFYCFGIIFHLPVLSPLISLVVCLICLLYVVCVGVSAEQVLLGSINQSINQSIYLLHCFTFIL